MNFRRFYFEEVATITNRNFFAGEMSAAVDRRIRLRNQIIFFFVGRQVIDLIRDPAIRDLADRLDGKPAQAIERSDVMVEMLTDAELLLIAAGGLPEALSETSYPKICVANWGLIWGLDRLSCKISKNYQHLNSHCWRREWDSNPLSLC